MPPSSSIYARTRDDKNGLILVGIDDTDNLESRGTGWHARRLAARLRADAIATPLDITRHQLLFDSRIPYTSHNSSLCLLVEPGPGGIEPIHAVCRGYLLAESAPGSDAGLCIATWEQVGSDIEAYGHRAKQDILTQADAEGLAAQHELVLEGLTGDHGGKIGALAAIGLRRSGRDGRIAWRTGLRETTGIATVADLLANTGIDEVRRADEGSLVDAEASIDVRPWPRAVMIDGRAVLLVEKAGSYHDKFDWQLASKLILHRY